MPDVFKHLDDKIAALSRILDTPFWSKVDFWISTVIGVAGILFSVLAFVEARRAKKAATEAGRIVKAQSIIIELKEVSQKLDKLRLDTSYSEARELLTEITRRLRRIIVQYKTDEGLVENITAVREALLSAKDALESVRPTDPSQNEVPCTVYYALESLFSDLNYCVADLLGLFEMRTTATGEQNA